MARAKEFTDNTGDYTVYANAWGYRVTENKSGTVVRDVIKERQDKGLGTCSPYTYLQAGKLWVADYEKKLKTEAATAGV